MEAFPGPIGYEPVKEGGSGADDFGHHVVLRFGSGQIYEPDPLHGIFSLQGFGDAAALGISLHENIETLAGLLIDSVQIGIQCSREQKPLEMTRMGRKKFEPLSFHRLSVVSPPPSRMVWIWGWKFISDPHV